MTDESRQFRPKNAIHLFAERTMIVDTQLLDLAVAAPLAQEPLLLMKDLELAHVGGGMEGACHF